MKEFFENVGNWFIGNWQPIVTTLAIIIFGLIIVKVILAVIKRQLAKTKMDRAVQGFIVSILKFVLYLILIFCIIASLGISVTGLTVVISAVSLAISLALQDSLKNLVNGFIIISTKLLNRGDWVEIAGVEGSVVEIRMLYVVLKTGDNKRITIPNSTILADEIVNYNINKTRRVDLTFDISYNSNVDQAKQIIHDVFNSCEAVYNDPEPTVVLSNLGASSITLTARAWCHADDYWNTKWYLIDNVFNEFKRNEIIIPYNQLEVALVEPNQKAFVREQKIEKAETHKIKPDEDDDIISSFNKTIKKVTKKKNKKQTKTNS
ncbi:MAG: mechanosensitive ion channel [Clostridia bacterium]|nr:mechanosensitive ion channel [Clostridia bacterium]